MKGFLSRNGSHTKFFHYADHDDTAAIQTVVDTDPLVKHVKTMRHQRENGKKYSNNTMNYVGSVDLELFRVWCAQKRIPYDLALRDNKHLIEYLNDPDNAKFKAIDGKI